MFERFTPQARHAVVLSQDEARGLQHNYIGTEHVLLGLLGERDGLAARVLERFGMSLTDAREEVAARVGHVKDPPKRRVRSTPGGTTVSAHIPFTPQAKKTLERALREALQLDHNYIGTEHLLLGLIWDANGTGAQIVAAHAGDLMRVRSAVLDLLPAERAAHGRRSLRRQGPARSPGETQETEGLRTTPAAGTSLDEAARLAGQGPVGSHHLLLAALADQSTAAARALAGAGINLDKVREALRHADVADTSDEQPEERGRRRMLIRVTGDRLAVEAADEALVRLGKSAAEALGRQTGEPDTIRGDHPASASLASLWQALHDSLEDIRRRAAAPGHAQDDEPPGERETGPAA